MTEEEVRVWKESLQQEGKRPKAFAWQGRGSESKYEHLPAIDSVIENASDGKLYLAGVRNGQLERLREMTLVETFDATPRAELVGKIREMLTPEEAKTVTEADFDLIIRIARRSLQEDLQHTTHDALFVGTIARTEAVRILAR